MKEIESSQFNEIRSPIHKNRYFTKVGHLFLEKSFFKEIKDIGIRFFITVDKMSILQSKMYWKDLIAAGFSQTGIASAIKSLEKNNIIKKNYYKNEENKKCTSIEIQDVTAINSKYWNKKLKQDNPIHEDRYYAQVPWLFLEKDFYGSDFKKLRNKIIGFYIYLTKFYNGKNTYIFKGTFRKIRADLGYHNPIINDCINFLKSKKIIEQKKGEIKLDIDNLIKMNISYFEKKEKTGTIVLSTKELKDRKSEKKKLKIKKSIIPKKSVTVQTLMRNENGTNETISITYNYKNQKVTWKEVNPSEAKISHAFDSYVELGFILYNKRLPTMLDIIREMSILKSYNEKNNWSVSYIMGLIKFTHREKEKDGFTAAYLKAMNKSFQAYLKEEEFNKEIIQSFKEEEQPLAALTSSDEKIIPLKVNEGVDWTKIKEKLL